MPVFENGNARIYYEDVGLGKPIITIHGLSEDCNYWSETGVTARIKEKYRVISIDMRGHGRTVVKAEPLGFDAATMASDFDALADGLGHMTAIEDPERTTAEIEDFLETVAETGKANRSSC